MSKLLHKTKLIFKKHPFLMNVATYGTMCVIAEIAQQSFRIKNSKQNSIDWNGVGGFAFTGTICIAPFLFNFYKCLDFALPAATKRVMLAKLSMDRLVAAPAAIAIFFTGMSVVERKEHVFAELKTKFWSTYKLNNFFWLPIQVINFALLPPYTRVAFVGVASFFWVNVLCLIKRQENSHHAIESLEILEKAANDLPISAALEPILTLI